MLASVASCAPMHPPANRQLVWADEFDGDALDLRCWERVVDAPPWDPQQSFAYIDSPETLHFRDGELLIDLYRRPAELNGRTLDYVSAQITTRDRAAWTYGYYEARMRMPPQAGAFPALWMMPQFETLGHWPASGEIDIIEYISRETNTAHTTIHFAGADGAHVALGNGFGAAAPLSNGFHVYGFEWRPGVMRWYLDNRLIFETRDWHRPNVRRRPSAPFDEPFHLLLNLAVGGSWAHEPPQDVAYPMQLAVDYIRVYRIPGVEAHGPRLEGGACPAGGPNGPGPTLAQTESADR